MNTLRPLALAVLLAASSGAAPGQTYRCQVGGSVVLSDRPCRTAPAPQEPKLGAIGPSTPSTTYRPGSGTAVRPAARVQDHVKYLSPACADISEAIRTAPARGVPHTVVHELGVEYRQKCEVEDQDARKKAAQDESDRRAVLQGQRDATLAAKEEAQARASRCSGMKDAITSRRRRESELKPPERDSLRALEATYNDVCVRR